MLPFLFLLIFIVIFSLFEKTPLASNFVNWPFKIVPFKTKSLTSSLVPVSKVPIFALIVPLNFFDTKVEGFELVKLSIIYFASSRFPEISIWLRLFFLEDVILKLLLSVLTVILLTDVIEKFSSRFKSNISILFLPAVIETLSSSVILFLTSPFKRIWPSSSNNLLKLIGEKLIKLFLISTFVSNKYWSLLIFNWM